MATNTQARDEQGTYGRLTAFVLNLGMQSTANDGTYATSNPAVRYHFPVATEYHQKDDEEVDLVPALTYEEAVTLGAKLRLSLPDYIEDVDLGPDI